eukprot:TRINITY_DN66668_c4_g3_i2.p2 TRINITY_DN66668_c4_g3~~TRINITY_DN66668_c4_g3_i2.p2  ORF type:complete len:110 (+),score=17.96 TRINITY_DN66668_c4_g3_i2:418-747(+)
MGEDARAHLEFIVDWLVLQLLQKKKIPFPDSLLVVNWKLLKDQHHPTGDFLLGVQFGEEAKGLAKARMEKASVMQNVEDVLTELQKCFPIQALPGSSFTQQELNTLLFG